jgi:hypothetical protein
MHPNATLAAPADLVLDHLPNGELAWLKPSEDLEPDDTRYWITEAGRLALRYAELFGTRPDDD